MTSGERYAMGGDDALHVEHYDLELDYRVAANRLDGVARLRIRTLAEVERATLDLTHLAVHAVRVDGARLKKWRHSSGQLILRFTGPVHADTQLVVEVRYDGHPVPVDSPWGPVGWEELDDGALTSNQPTGARTWFPCNDRPSDKSTYTTTLTVQAPYRGYAHGVLVSERTRAGRTTRVFEQRRPTSTYLAAIHVGQYDEHPLALAPVRQTLVCPAVLRREVVARLRDHQHLLSTFSSLFGPYPFAEYRLVVTPDPLEIPLEFQAGSVFGANHLSDAADGDRLIAHELAHQWFGNCLTVRSWQDIWLNEGFACYAEWLWSEASGGPPADEHARRWRAQLRRSPQDLVLANPGPERIFDDAVYKRGALTLHALRGALGTAGFVALLHDWTRRHAHGVVTTADLRDLAVEHAPDPGTVSDLLSAWLDRPELPTVPRAGRAERLPV